MSGKWTKTTTDTGLSSTAISWLGTKRSLLDSDFLKQGYLTLGLHVIPYFQIFVLCTCSETDAVWVATVSGQDDYFIVILVE